MRPFHVTIHACPERLLVAQHRLIDGNDVEVLLVDPSELCLPFRVSFDAVAERLTTLPRVFFEPDGSFVWVSSKGRGDWQLDGLLTDGRENLMTIELKGIAGWDVLQPLLETIDWPNHDVLFQDMQRGVFFSSASFRDFFAA